MSGTSSMTNKVSTDSRERWAALDSRNERLVSAADPVIAELRRDQDDDDEELPAAS
jgi:hypothetical protein